MSTMNGVLSLERQLKKQLNSRLKSEYFLKNPHQWADEVIGVDLYERHTLAGSKWRGWGEYQIGFLRDITDMTIPFTMGICNRGGSKTWLTAVGLCCLLDNIEGIKANVLSGSFKQAKTCYKYSRDIFLNTDMALKVLRTTMEESDIVGGGGLSVLAATENQTRAPRTDILVLDEACLITQSLIDSYLPQAITAVNLKIIVITTPNKQDHQVKRWWDMADKLGLIRHQWGAQHCSWVPKKNLEFFRNIYDENTYRVEVGGEWGSVAGSVFQYSDLQRTYCDMTDLPAFDDIDKFYLGIDWGDAHPTVAIILGMRGNVSLGTDEWFVYYVQEWKRTDLSIILQGGYKSVDGKRYSRDEVILEDLDTDEMTEIWGLMDIIRFYQPSIYSEQSAVSAHGNRKLRKLLYDEGVTFRTSSFSKKKHRVVANLKGTLEAGRMKIPRVFRLLHSQLGAYTYKIVQDEVREEFKKGNDDYVDSILWARWCIHPAQGQIVEIGEIGDLEI